MRSKLVETIMKRDILPQCNIDGNSKDPQHGVPSRQHHNPFCGNGSATRKHHTHGQHPWHPDAIRHLENAAEIIKPRHLS